MATRSRGTALRLSAGGGRRPDESGDESKLGNIGLAILRSDVAVDGGAVEVALGDGTVAATIDVLAVYDPQKRRPRS
jgi:hypothetical protein